MKGLLLKDFYNLKAAMKTLIIILAIFIAFVIIRNYEFILPLIPVLLSSSLLTTVVSMDKNSKWNMLMMTAPLKRKELVQEKYLLLLLLNAGGILIGAVSSAPFILSGKIKMVSFADMILLGWSLSLLQGTIFLTYTYVFDKNVLEKLELMMVISYMVSFAIILPLYYLIPDLFGTQNHSLIISHFAVLILIFVINAILQRAAVIKNIKSERI